MDSIMRLVDHLRTELMELNLRSQTKDEVLRELSDLLPIDEKSKEMLIETLKKRIPHCRSLLVKKLYIVIGRSRKGMDFKSLDGKPVHIFFLIVAPPQEPSNQYLIALGKVAQMARELSKKKEALEIEDKQDFLRFLSKLDSG